jgi:hypothetical protein
VFLTEDFYAISFIAHTKYVQNKFHVTNKMQGRNFYACLWIYLIEMSLITMIIKTVVFDVDILAIYTPNIEVYITRFIASLLLHMELIEDVK